MKQIQIRKLSPVYAVRRLGLNDAESILQLCKGNTQYYEYCGKQPSLALIEQDLIVTPPGIPQEQKYYVGFFAEDVLMAVMDLIDGYPDEKSAFIGFFMMNHMCQGKGEGTKIVSHVFEHLRENGFEKCLLGIDKDNPQSNHFWKKNGFRVIREVEREDGTILVAEKLLQSKRSC